MNIPPEVIESALTRSKIWPIASGNIFDDWQLPKHTNISFQLSLIHYFNSSTDILSELFDDISDTSDMNEETQLHGTQVNFDGATVTCNKPKQVVKTELKSLKIVSPVILFTIMKSLIHKFGSMYKSVCVQLFKFILLTVTLQ